MLVADAPYITNYMATGEEYPKPYSKQREEMEDALITLEDELRTIEELEQLSEPIKTDLIEFYETRILNCKEDIENMEDRYCEANK